MTAYRFIKYSFLPLSKSSSHASLRISHVKRYSQANTNSTIDNTDMVNQVRDALEKNDFLTVFKRIISHNDKNGYIPPKVFEMSLEACSKKRDPKITTALFLRYLGTRDQSNLDAVVLKYFKSILACSSMYEGRIGQPFDEWKQAAVDECLFSAYEYIDKELAGPTRQPFNKDSILLVCTRLVESGYIKEARELIRNSLKTFGNKDGDFIVEAARLMLKIGKRDGARSLEDQLRAAKDLDNLARLYELYAKYSCFEDVQRLQEELYGLHNRMGDKGTEAFARGLCLAVKVAASPDAPRLKYAIDTRLLLQKLYGTKYPEVAANALGFVQKAMIESIGFYLRDLEQDLPEEFRMEMLKQAEYFMPEIFSIEEKLKRENRISVQNFKNLTRLYTYLSILDPCKYRVENASKQLEAALKIGIHPDTELFNDVIFAYASSPNPQLPFSELFQSRVAHCLQLLNRMHDLRVSPNSETAQYLFKALEFPQQDPNEKLFDPLVKDVFSSARVQIFNLRIPQDRKMIQQKLKTYVRACMFNRYFHNIDHLLRHFPAMITSESLNFYFEFAKRFPDYAPHALHLFRSVEIDGPEILSRLEPEALHNLFESCLALRNAGEAVRIYQKAAQQLNSFSKAQLLVDIAEKFVNSVDTDGESDEVCVDGDVTKFSVMTKTRLLDFLDKESLEVLKQYKKEKAQVKEEFDEIIQ